MQDSFSIFLPAVVGLAVLFVFAVLHFDRSESDSKALDPSKTAANTPPSSAPGKPPH